MSKFDTTDYGVTDHRVTRWKNRTSGKGSTVSDFWEIALERNTPSAIRR
jgi:hypothetical protein